MWKFLEKLRALIPFLQENPCSKLGIPKYLHSRKRLKDNHFLSSEKIYRRFTAKGRAEDWKNDKALSAVVFPVEDDSVNRSAYCEKPEDVLYNTREKDEGKHYWNHGILLFQVNKFKELSLEPKEPIRLNGVERDFTFHLEHCPQPCMYPHSEIWVMEGGKRVDNQPPRSIRAIARSQLVGICDIYKYPLPQPV